MTDTIRTLVTSEYPTRYVAFDRPRTLVRAREVQPRGGFEAAVYSDVKPNPFLPSVQDGVYVEVVSADSPKSRGVSGWRLKACASRPDDQREQHGVSEFHEDLDEALKRAREVILELTRWVTDYENPRWVACRRALGREPGSHEEFMAWVAPRWKEWRKEHPDGDYAEFDLWVS